MSDSVLVQARIDPEIKARAAEVLGAMGLSVSDAVRILLTRTANEGALPSGLMASEQQHDAWFRAKVREALDDLGTDLGHDEVEKRMAQRRQAAKAAR